MAEIITSMKNIPSKPSQVVHGVKPPNVFLRY